MLGWLWSWLTAGEQSGEGAEPDEKRDDGDGGFLPSRLDASVLFSHGGPRPERTSETEDEREALEAEIEAIEEFQDEK